MEQISNYLPEENNLENSDNQQMTPNELIQKRMNNPNTSITDEDINNLKLDTDSSRVLKEDYIESEELLKNRSSDDEDDRDDKDGKEIITTPFDILG
jgi:hypothetical protein